MPVTLSFWTTWAAKRFGPHAVNVCSSCNFHVVFDFLGFLLQVNAVNCNTSWKVTLFMKFSDYKEDILKGVRVLIQLLFYFNCMPTSSMNYIYFLFFKYFFFSSGGRCEAVSCRAREVSHMRRVQEAAVCLSQDNAEAVCHLCHQLQGPLGGWGKANRWKDKIIFFLKVFTQDSPSGKWGYYDAISAFWDKIFTFQLQSLAQQTSVPKWVI